MVVMSDAIPDWLGDELGTVTAYDGFLGVDGLVTGLEAVAAAHPDLSTLRRVGTSRQGEPLWCLTVADAEHDDATPDALVLGLPHPNEPIGGLTALHLASRLCEDQVLRRRLGHRWHVVACIDPDGLRLNEGWLAGPYDRATYARHFYRPAGVDQVEWTFPVSVGEVYFDDAIAETQAVMRLIDSTNRPCSPPSTTANSAAPTTTSAAPSRGCIGCWSGDDRHPGHPTVVEGRRHEVAECGPGRRVGRHAALARRGGRRNTRPRKRGHDESDPELTESVHDTTVDDDRLTRFRKPALPSTGSGPDAVADMTSTHGTLVAAGAVGPIEE